MCPTPIMGNVKFHSYIYPQRYSLKYLFLSRNCTICVNPPKMWVSISAITPEYFQHFSTITFIVEPQGGGGVLQVLSDGDDRIGAKIKTQKNPLGFQQNPKKSLNQKFTPKKSHAEFPSLNFQTGLNDITRKKHNN